jgi:hypothetical protein
LSIHFLKEAASRQLRAASRVFLTLDGMCQEPARSQAGMLMLMLDVGCWMLDVGCWMLDVGCWMLEFKNGGYWLQVDSLKKNQLNSAFSVSRNK